MAGKFPKIGTPPTTKEVPGCCTVIIVAWLPTGVMYGSCWYVGGGGW